MVLIKKRLSYTDSKLYCGRLGGQMAMDIPFKYQQLDTMIEIGSENCPKTFWVPIVQGDLAPNGSYHWIDDRRESHKRPAIVPKINWRDSQPNGMQHQQCVAQNLNPPKNGLYYDFECHMQKFCSVCILPEIQFFYLRGLSELDETTDWKYSLIWGIQSNGSDVIMDGSKQGYIHWYPDSSTAAIFDDQDRLIINSRQNPFGLQIWNGTKYTFTQVS